MTITELKNDLAEKIRAQTGENVYLCYQCVKCTAGCCLAEFFDLAPNQVMRAAQLGLDDTVLHAKTPWLCASCQTCTTRCPQGIDVARVMDFMVMEALARGIPARFVGDLRSHLVQSSSCGGAGSNPVPRSRRQI